MIVNSLVYYARDDKKYVAECLEISQIACGDTKQEARKDLVKCLNVLIESARKDATIDLFGRVGYTDSDTVSERCIDGLARILLRRAVPDAVEKNHDFEIHFYNERRK